jgi:hypothetical protein
MILIARNVSGSLKGEYFAIFSIAIFFCRNLVRFKQRMIILFDPKSPLRIKGWIFNFTWDISHDF